MLTPMEMELRKQRRLDLQVIQTVQAAAYSTGNVLGGLITLDNANGIEGPSKEADLASILQSIAVMDPSSQSPAIDLFFFNQKPATTFTDKTAFAPSAADLLNLVGVVSVATGDFKAAGSNGTIAAGASQANLGRVLKPAGTNTAGKPNTGLYCVPVVRGTPTFTATTLAFRFQFSQGL